MAEEGVVGLGISGGGWRGNSRGVLAFGIRLILTAKGRGG